MRKDSGSLDDGLKYYLKKVEVDLEKVIELRKQGNNEAADALLLNVKEDIKEKGRTIIDQMPDAKYEESKYNIRLPPKGTEIARDEILRLKRISPDEYDNYLKVSIECSEIGEVYEDRRFREKFWKGFLYDNELNCSIYTIDTNIYVGYCSIKDLERDTYELAIELCKDYRKKGYGYRALSLLMQYAFEHTGKNVYRVCVRPDNYSSQALFKKLGAYETGISDYLLRGEMLKEFQEKNADKIDDRLKEVADTFGVNPKELIGRVLEYRIDWKDVRT